MFLQPHILGQPVLCQSLDARCRVTVAVQRSHCRSVTRHITKGILWIFRNPSPSPNPTPRPNLTQNLILTLTLIHLLSG